MLLMYELYITLHEIAHCVSGLKRQPFQGAIGTPIYLGISVC